MLVHDPELFTNLAAHLENSKQPEDDYDGEDQIESWNIDIMRWRARKKDEEINKIVWQHSKARNEEALVMQDTTI